MSDYNLRLAEEARRDYLKELRLIEDARAQAEYFKLKAEEVKMRRLEKIEYLKGQFQITLALLFFFDK